MLTPGDILLLYDEPDNTTFRHGLITMGQARIAGFFGSDSTSRKLVHAVMWVYGVEPGSPFEIVEASGKAGKVRKRYLRKGLYSPMSSTAETPTTPHWDDSRRRSRLPLGIRQHP